MASRRMVLSPLGHRPGGMSDRSSAILAKPFSVKPRLCLYLSTGSGWAETPSSAGGASFSRFGSAGTGDWLIVNHPIQKTIRATPLDNIEDLWLLSWCWAMMLAFEVTAAPTLGASYCC